MKKHLLRMWLVVLMAVIGIGAQAQTTWQFAGNTDMWGADGITLSGGAQYDENANVVTTGGVTFTGTSGFVATPRGIGFYATGSTEAENISVVVPAGYKASVSAYTSGNRTIVGKMGEITQTFNAGWASATKDFDNSTGTEDVTLYLYCNQNAGGADQSKAPFLEKIVLMDMSTMKTYPWTANAVATINGSKTTIKTYNSTDEVIEGAEFTVTVDKVINYDGKYYVLNDDQFDVDVYGKAFTMGNAAAALEFNYEEIANVAFYGEVENIYTEGQRANKIQNVSVLSNGGGYTGQGTEGFVRLTFNVPEKAVYKLALGTNNTNSRERGFNYSIDGADVSETITVAAGKAFVQEIENQTLEAGDHTITLNITYSLTPIFDYLLITKTGDVEVAEKTYTVAGAPEGLFGALWDASNAAGDMTLNTETGLYEWSKADATLTAGDIEFKVVVNHAWDEAYPADNYKLNIAEDGTYDVAITFNAETKEVAATATKKGEAVIEKTYTVAGAPASLFGAEWDPSNTAGDMTLNTESGLYEWSKADATLAAGKVEFKVVVNHAWDEAYPGSNYELAIAEDGKYDVAITFNAETKEVAATATKKGEAVIEKTYTVAGNDANLFGTSWDPSNETNNMTLNTETGLYEWSKTDIELTDAIEFKVVMNHDWANAWPASNYVLNIDGEGTYDVAITFDAESKAVNATATKKGETPVLNTYTASFTTNAGWGEVYAYAWTTEGENTTEFLGAWPGTKLEDNEGVYTATIKAAAAPAYIIFNNGMGAQTADLEFEDGKAYEFKISDEWAAAIAAAAAEAEEDGVAVGKLIEAIAKAQGQTGTDEEKAALQDAVDQYKADNAPQETDLTSQFSALTDWTKWTGATGYTATNYCPAVDINDGSKKQVCEKYETTCATTGDIFYQTVTGLTTGTYKIELYGGAAFTFGRGFGSMAFTGEIGTGDAWGTHNSDTYTAGQHIDTETGVKMYAITSEGTYEEEIPIYYATNFPDGAATVVLDGVKVGVNGEVKIGMNKTSQSTNWHVVQLKGVTAQVLAKDLYAAHQTELQALVAEAQALAADENKTEGKEAFQEALTTAELAVNSQWYNNTEIEGIINNLKNAIANFKKANYFIDFAAGEYYVIDAESGKMMAAGSSYGTRGIVNETGLDLYLTPYTESRTVTFDSRVANNESDHFLGINLYMDSSSWGWALEYQGFGFYIKDPDGGKYINIDENDNLVLSDTPREFIIVTKDGVMEERMEELADATETNPVDATFLLQNPNFNRNDQRVSAWEWIPSETAEENADNWNNHNFNGGNQVNNCAESYHAAFVVKQTVSGAPAGKYTMTAQGFYRQDTFEGDAPAAPMFFANGVNKDVPAKTGEENSMSTASESFTSGLYTIEPVEFEVADDGMIYVGVTAAVHNQWVIFDNFQLKYYGKKDITDGISTIETEALKGNVYNLQGQKVEKAVKGLYIVNGKKVVKK